jgi:xanthine dehydrogenase YagR molybdenum-binding subunit
VKVSYEILPHVVKEQDLTKVGDRVSPAADKTKGDPEAAFAAAGAVVHEGFYGLPVITHCCLESHGQVVEWDGDNIIVYASTQAVGRIGADLAKNLSADDRFGSVSPANVRVVTPVMGGGFGSKFAIDSWGIACAKLAKTTGKPVKLMLDRDEELLLGGTRPSDFGTIKVAATKDGKITAYQSETWSTGGIGSRGAPPLPYVVEPEHSLIRHTSVETNTGPARAWRAPNHPQAAVLTHCALTDLAAKLKMDPLDLYLKNLDLTARPDIYREELLKGAELIDWRVKYHEPGAKKDGPMRRGLGLSIHTWGGRPHDSDCRVSIYPDGTAVAELGSQDLGSGSAPALSASAAVSMASASRMPPGIRNSLASMRHQIPKPEPTRARTARSVSTRNRARFSREPP